MEFNYTYTEDCIFKESCPRKEKIGCDEHCTIQPEFMYLLTMSNIPEINKKKILLYPSNRDLTTFTVLKEIQMDIEAFVEEGRILYLWGEGSGTGKTTWACKLLKTYLAVICIGNAFRDRAYFAYVPSLLLLAKDFDNTFRKEVLDSLLTLDLIILDDIGAVQNSNYDTTILSNIIDTRYRNHKSTIYTSNLSPQQLGEVLGIRLKDRICSDIILQIKGGSHRKGTDTYQRRGAS